MVVASTEGIAQRIEPLLHRLDPSKGRDRPFALAFWDGSELPATVAHPGFMLRVRHPDALAHLVSEPGELGLARAWVCGALDVDGDIEEAFALLRDRVDGGRLGPREWAELAAIAARLGALRLPPIPASEARMRGRVHSLRRDSAAVRHHYDVTTDFYRLVLGPSLVYSAALFGSPDDTLERAQERKLDLICRKLDLQEGERFLDVGCGWGSLIMHAAERYGVRATGVTLSPSQAAEARRRIAAAGPGDRCDVRVLDYRELRDGPFDKLAERARIWRLYMAASAHAFDRGVYQTLAIAPTSGRTA